MSGIRTLQLSPGSPQPRGGNDLPSPWCWRIKALQLPAGAAHGPTLQLPAGCAHMSATVLLVDRDSACLNDLADYLRGSGVNVLTARDGESGAEQALTRRPDVVVLALSLPPMSGIDALVAIRGDGAVPVLLFAASNGDADRLGGLEIGADDCVPLYCTQRELAARIRAIVKRLQPPEDDLSVPTPIAIGSLTLWPAQRRAERDGSPLELTSTEFNLLEILARNVGRTVSKSELSLKALGRPLRPFDRSVDVHVSSIRAKLGYTVDGRWIIQTVVRKGYQLIMD